jgi:hypothetical protein
MRRIALLAIPVVVLAACGGGTSARHGDAANARALAEYRLGTSALTNGDAPSAYQHYAAAASLSDDPTIHDCSATTASFFDGVPSSTSDLGAYNSAMAAYNAWFVSGVRPDCVRFAGAADSASSRAAAAPTVAPAPSSASSRVAAAPTVAPAPSTTATAASAPTTTVPTPTTTTVPLPDNAVSSFDALVPFIGAWSVARQNTLAEQDWQKLVSNIIDASKHACDAWSGAYPAESAEVCAIGAKPVPGLINKPGQISEDMASMLTYLDGHLSSAVQKLQDVVNHHQ